MKLNNTKNKIVIVGATSGIGYETALLYIQEGVGQSVSQEEELTCWKRYKKLHLSIYLSSLWTSRNQTLLKS